MPKKIEKIMGELGRFCFRYDLELTPSIRKSLSNAIDFLYDAKQKLTDQDDS